MQGDQQALWSLGCCFQTDVGQGNVGVGARDGGQDTQHDIVNLGSKVKQEIIVIVVNA